MNYTREEKEQLIYPLSALVQNTLGFLFRDITVGTNFLLYIQIILMAVQVIFKVADFGGTLGLFIGFSFITVWDGLAAFALVAAKILNISNNQ